MHRARVRVKPVAEDATAPPQDPIHGLRDANGQSLKPARKHAAIDRLHEQVQMVALHREVQYAQAAARGQKRPCLRASELGETHTRRTRARCMLVCPVVRRVADSD